MLGGAVTVTVAEPDLVESCVEVAVTVAVPALVGVKTPTVLTLPMVEGLTDQLTELLKLPDPETFGVQADVWLVWMDVGKHTAVTEVIVEGAVTVTVAEPDLVKSSVDVAVIATVPVAEGVNTPADVIVPYVADQVTPELKLPVPLSVGVQVDV
jgi:hypothetical protein